MPNGDLWDLAAASNRHFDRQILPDADIQQMPSPFD
jgi:hypothetical protein